MALPLPDCKRTEGVLQKGWPVTWQGGPSPALLGFITREICLASTKELTDPTGYQPSRKSSMRLSLWYAILSRLTGGIPTEPGENRTSKPVLNLRLAVALLACWAVAGCASQNGGPAVASISNIEVGMTEGQVLSILGQPRVRESYGGTSFLFYADTAGTSIPIAIVDGRVTSIGRGAYDIVVRSQTQTAGSVRR